MANAKDEEDAKFVRFFATRDGAPPIELIDGEKLLDMLEKLELGLRPVTTYEVERTLFREFCAD